MLISNQGTLWSGVAVSFCFLLFRFYVRLKTFRRLDIDDPFVFVAWLMTLANAIVWQVTSKELYDIIAVDTGQRLMPKPEYNSRVYIMHHSLVATYFLYYTALWSIKLSFLLFFRNLSKTTRRQILLWYFVCALTIASYIICLCMINYKCLVEPHKTGKVASRPREYGLTSCFHSRMSKPPYRLLLDPIPSSSYCL